MARMSIVTSYDGIRTMYELDMQSLLIGPGQKYKKCGLQR